MEFFRHYSGKFQRLNGEQMAHEGSVCSIEGFMIIGYGRIDVCRRKLSPLVSTTYYSESTRRNRRLKLCLRYIAK